jgi:hypothetical protein
VTSLREIDDLLARIQQEPRLEADDRARAIVELVKVLSERDLADRERQAELRERYLLTALEDVASVPADGGRALAASGGSANAIAFPSGSGSFTWRTPFE